MDILIEQVGLDNCFMFGIVDMKMVVIIFFFADGTVPRLSIQLRLPVL